ncbi:hypothetical protein L1887_29172 [Cichorium endivia]|nr:hypothetical protein L1887_29172 [Cichorium endivia]
MRYLGPAPGRWWSAAVETNRRSDIEMGDASDSTDDLSELGKRGHPTWKKQADDSRRNSVRELKKHSSGGYVEGRKRQGQERKREAVTEVLSTGGGIHPQYDSLRCWLIRVSSVTDTLLCKKAVNFPPASGTSVSVYGAPVIRFIAIYFMITEAEAQVFLFSHVDVWQVFQRELFPILICDLGIAQTKCDFQIKHGL